MALGNLFKLARLTIEAFHDIERQCPLDVPGGNSLEAAYNPDALTVQYENVYNDRQPAGRQGSPGQWLQSRSKQQTFKLLFDGTHVGHFGVERPGLATVAEQVERFMVLCYRLYGESHEPPYLRLHWNKDILGLDGFECRLHSLAINYSAFERDGSPLRAELTVRFVEAVARPKMDASHRTSSPDLTHRRVVRSGDTLPALCRQIYGSAVHHVRVAEVNGLDDLRSLVPGTELIFPPFARKERG
jgi:phage tail protein X